MAIDFGFSPIPDNEKHTGWIKVFKKTLESAVYIIRVGVLCINVIQEAKQDLRVSVEENNLKSELLSQILPGPQQTVHVREGGVEEEGGKGFVRMRWGWG